MKISKDYKLKVLLLSPYPDNIIKTIEHHGDIVDVVNTKIDVNFIRINSYDFIISFGYLFILDVDTINAVKFSAINLHISYLPFNRGAHPNVWSNIENTISGVTIHLIDEGLDTGNLLFQKEVAIDQDKHTFLTSYQLLISEIEYLFKMNWRYLRTNECKGWKQQGAGSFHYRKDLEGLRPFFNKGWDTNISEFRSNYLKSVKSN